MLCAGLVSGAGLAASAPPLARSLVWTASGAELETLSSQPRSCLSGKDDALLQSGRALFNAPLLLGGQAAKAELSCNSCHVAGRDNPHFFLPRLSSAPGTADVTSSFFSAARGNAKFDPVQIPDLARPGKISRDSAKPALEGFIRDLVVEEFSGDEPSKATLAALARYVRAIRACEGENGGQNVARKLADQLSLIDSAVDGAVSMANVGEEGTARLLLTAARHQLGLIDERYARRRLKRERKMLRSASRSLQEMNELPDFTANLLPAIAKWKSEFAGKLRPALQRKERRSYYNQTKLKKALQQRPPQR